MEKLKLLFCPNCHVTWGDEEISFQECDACGYPNEDDDDRPNDDDDWEDYEPLSVKDLQALGIPISDDPAPSV